MRDRLNLPVASRPLLRSGGSIVEVKTKSQIIFPFSESTTQNNENKSSFERENREIWRLVVSATIIECLTLMSTPTKAALTARLLSWRASAISGSKLCSTVCARGWSKISPE